MMETDFDMHSTSKSRSSSTLKIDEGSGARYLAVGQSRLVDLASTNALLNRPFIPTSSRVLVTGASGFIGSRLVEYLQLAGADVHTAGRASTSGIAPSYIVDLTDQAESADLIEGVQPDIVFHLASAVKGGRDLELVNATTSANLLIAINLMSAVVAKSGHSRVVLAGSLEEQGSGIDGIPGSPYAAAKSAATLYARMYSRLWGLRVTVLRIAMAYGPGQGDSSKLVPYVIRKLLDREAPQLTSGSRRVDWVFVDDVVEAFVRTASSDQSIGQVIDIGSGTQASIHQVVELLTSMIPGAPEPEFGALADRPMDPDRLADTVGARDLIGWTARTGLVDGLRETVNWYSGQR